MDGIRFVRSQTTCRKKPCETQLMSPVGFRDHKCKQVLGASAAKLRAHSLKELINQHAVSKRDDAGAAVSLWVETQSGERRQIQRTIHVNGSGQVTSKYRWSCGADTLTLSSKADITKWLACHGLDVTNERRFVLAQKYVAWVCPNTPHSPLLPCCWVQPNFTGC